MARTAVGLDIGTHAVHVAEVSLRGTPTVTNFGGVGLPDDAVREGEILDTAAVGDAIRELVAAAKLKEKRVQLGVANQRVVVRQIELPWMEESELRESLPFQVQEFIPIPVEDAQLDFHILEEITSEDGARSLRLLLVAAQVDMLRSHIDAVRAGGLKPVGVDLNSFAQLRAVARDSVVHDGPEVLMDVGAGVTDIVVHERGVPIFVRILVLGGGDITDALVAELDIDRTEAERIKQEGADPEDQQAGAILEEHLRQFTEEARGSLDYFRTQVAAGGPIQRIVLTGGGALLAGLVDRLGQATNLPVEIGNPFTRFDAGRTAYGPDELAVLGPTLTTAIGLAAGAGT